MLLGNEIEAPAQSEEGCPSKDGVFPAFKNQIQNDQTHKKDGEVDFRDKEPQTGFQDRNDTLDFST